MAKVFPLDRLVPARATLSRNAGDAAIEIELEPFELNGQSLSTSIILEGIDLPTLAFVDLSETEHRFPTNPDDGYIDGSMYLVHAHHPVDVSSIKFGKAADDSIPATLNCKFQFEFERLQDNAGQDYANIEAELTVVLSVEA